MREVTLSVPNHDFAFIQRMVKGFGWKYTEMSQQGEVTKEEVLQSLDRAFAEFHEMKATGRKGRKAE